MGQIRIRYLDPFFGGLIRIRYQNPLVCGIDSDPIQGSVFFNRIRIRYQHPFFVCRIWVRYQDPFFCYPNSDPIPASDFCHSVTGSAPFCCISNFTFELTGVANTSYSEADPDPSWSSWIKLRDGKFSENHENMFL